MRVTTYTCDDCLKNVPEKDVIRVGERDYCRNCLGMRVQHSFLTSKNKNCTECKGKGTTTWNDYGEQRSETCSKCKGCGYKIGA